MKNKLLTASMVLFLMPVCANANRVETECTYERTTAHVILEIEDAHITVGQKSNIHYYYKIVGSASNEYSGSIMEIWLNHCNSGSCGTERMAVIPSDPHETARTIENSGTFYGDKIKTTPGTYTNDFNVNIPSIYCRVKVESTTYVQ